MGPLLFSLYVTDLPNCLQASNLLMYADDTVIYSYFAASDASHLLQVLNDEVKFLLDWSNKSDLIIHPKKTEYVIFGTSIKLNQSDSVNLSKVYLGGQVLNVYLFISI